MLRSSYPWDLPAIAALADGLTLHPEVTYGQLIDRRSAAARFAGPHRVARVKLASPSCLRLAV